MSARGGAARGGAARGGAARDGAARDGDQRGLVRALAAACALAAAILGGAPVAAEDVPEAPGVIPVAVVRVPRPGTHAVRWTPELSHRLHGVPACAVVVSPDGARLGLTSLQRPTERTRHATISDVTLDEVGWRVIVDVHGSRREGSSPADADDRALAGALPAHEALILRLAEASAGVAVLVEEPSEDGDGWRPVGEASIFRLGSAESLRDEVLAYPPSRSAVLRVTWPRSAGEPRLDEALVRFTGEATEVSELRDALVGDLETNGRGGATTWRLDHSGGPVPLSRLSLGWPDAGEGVGLRLSAISDGTWREISTGHARMDGARLELGGVPDGVTTPLLVELSTAHGRPPSSLEAEAEMPSGWWSFRTQERGLHLLGCQLDRLPRDPAPPALNEAMNAESEPGGTLLDARLVEPSAARLPADLADAARAAPADTVVARFPLRSKAAPPGVLVRATVTDAVWSASSRRLGGLRVERGGRLIPHLVARHDEPALARHTVVTPTLASDGWSEARWELPGRGAPWVTLELRATGGPFERPVAVLAERPGPRGAPPDRILLRADVWRCQVSAPLPCVLQVPVPDEDAPAIVVRVDDGDEPPLPLVQLRLWTQAASIVLPWPRGGGDEAVLLVGSRDMPSARYDLQAVAGRIAHRATHEAMLGPALEDPSGATDALPAWAVVAALAVAAVALLAVIVRAVGAGDAGGADASALDEGRTGTGSG